MDNAERFELIHSWIKYWRTGEDTGVRKALTWASDQFFDISLDSPELCMQLCKEILEQNPEDDLLAILAAGPLETVLVHHGPGIIEEVEATAVANERFRHLLGGVWKNAMADEIWARVCKAREEVW